MSNEQMKKEHLECAKALEKVLQIMENANLSELTWDLVEKNIKWHKEEAERY